MEQTTLTIESTGIKIWFRYLDNQDLAWLERITAIFLTEKKHFDGAALIAFLLKQYGYQKECTPYGVAVYPESTNILDVQKYILRINGNLEEID